MGTEQQSNKIKRKLEFFLFTIHEYRLITSQLPIVWNKKEHEIDYDEEYAAIVTRSMMLRKYITKGDRSWIGEITPAMKNFFKNQVAEISRLYKQYTDVYEKGIEQSLGDGTVLSLRETFDDLLYGVFLHADTNRIEHLMLADKTICLLCMRGFIKEIEDILFQFEAFLIRNRINIPNKKHHTKGVSLAIKDANTATEKNIPGYWSNLYGKKVEDEDGDTVINRFIHGKTPEEMQIIACAVLFLNRLTDQSATQENMIDIVYQPQAEIWSDFSEAKKYMNNMSNPGIANGITFNNRHDVAMIKVLENIDVNFEITQPHFIPAHVIVLVRDLEIDKWRVFSFGGYINPYINTS